MRDFSFVKTDHPTMAEFNARFGNIADFINNLGNEYVWERILKIPVVTLGTLTANVAFGSAMSLESFTFYCSDELGNDGLLKNPQTVTVLYNSPASTASVLKGKFWSRYTDSLTSIYYTPSDAKDAYIGTYTIGSTKYNHSLFIYSQTVTVAFNVTKSYVNSSNPNAYPVDDGYIYTALGQLGNKVQIATGSYTGTGTYGASKPCSLTFDFDVKAFVVRSPGGGSDGNGFIMLGTGTTGVEGDTGGAYQVTATSFGNVVTWYGTQDAGKQMNLSGATYRYIAIG